MGATDSSCCGCAAKGKITDVDSKFNTRPKAPLLPASNSPDKKSSPSPPFDTECTGDGMESLTGTSSFDNSNVNNNDNNDNNNKKIKKKKRKKEYKFNHPKIQMEILNNSDLRNQSLILCCKLEKISKRGKIKEFPFLKYLQTNISKNASKTLFAKFSDPTLSSSQFLSLLIMTVILYRAKLNKLRHVDKPELDRSQIREQVKHLAAWIIRTYGDIDKQRKTRVMVYDKNKGEKISKYYHFKKLKVTSDIFADNIHNWTQKYVDESGEYVFND